MTTTFFLKVTDPILPVTDALSECRRSQEAGEEIRDQVAKTIASLWQGPGRPGSALAAFASGATIDIDILREDLSWTIQEYYSRPETQKSDKLGLDMLGTYLIAKRNELVAVGGYCPQCGRQHDRHAISGELTCAVHGNPAGSDFERKIWRDRKSASELELRSRVLGARDAQRDRAHASHHKNEKGF